MLADQDTARRIRRALRVRPHAAPAGTIRMHSRLIAPPLLPSIGARLYIETSTPYTMHAATSRPGAQPADPGVDGYSEQCHARGPRRMFRNVTP